VEQNNLDKLYTKKEMELYAKDNQNKLESEHTDLISSALAIAQGEYLDISVNKKSYVGSYADFYSIVKSVRPALAKNKLSVTQQIKYINDLMLLSTTIRHSSGQWIESRIPVLSKFVSQNEKNKAPLQNFGAALSYLKRYSFLALLNIVHND